MSNNSKQQLACLYTKHKTQKRKVWQDGRLVLNAKSSKAILHDADPPPGSGDPSLGECEISSCQLQTILQQFNGNTANVGGTTMLETERYLIEIEGPWTNNNSSAISQIPKQPQVGNKNPSSSMQKLLKSKFQRPKCYVPPPPGTQNSRMQQILGKRRRPLQPGELVARHYGGNGGHFGGNRGGFNDSQPYWNDQQQAQHPPRNNFPQHNRVNTGETNFQGQSQFHPEIQRHGQGHQNASRAQPVNSVQSSFRTFGESEKPLESAREIGASIASIGTQFGHGPPKQKRHRRPVPKGRNNPSAFAQNEFDSSKYYGNDEEEEENDGEKVSSASSQAPPHVEGGNDQRDDERHKRDSGSVMNPYINRTNKADHKNSNGQSIHFSNNVQQEGTQLPIPTNPHVHQNQSQPSSMPLSNRNANENDIIISNSTRKTHVSVSKSAMEEHCQSDKISSLAPDQKHYRKKEFDEDEESDEEDDDFSDDDMGAPLSFRLKALLPPANTNTNGKAKHSSAISGNRLLALFGTGTNEKAFRSDENDDEKNNIAENRSNERKANDKENAGVMAVPGESGDTKTGKAKNDQKDKTQKQQGNLSGDSGFYLPPADTSSDESSDEE